MSFFCVGDGPCYSVVVCCAVYEKLITAKLWKNKFSNKTPNKFSSQPLLLTQIEFKQEVTFVGVLCWLQDSEDIYKYNKMISFLSAEL